MGQFDRPPVLRPTVSGRQFVDSATHEIELSGGNLSQVVRIGDTVRRSIRPWSAAVHSLLHHVAAKGFSGAPRFLGIDEKGRESLTFLDGEVGFPSYMWTEPVLIAAAQLLRQYHDATVDFHDEGDANWQYVYPNVAEHEVICHNDFAPYNLVFNQQLPTALIDFDVAGPGPRLRDVAMGAYWFAPLSFGGEAERSLADLQGGSHRLQLFCTSYGIMPSIELIDMVETWLSFMSTFPLEQIAAGFTEYQRLVDEGHVAHWRNEYLVFGQHRAALVENLL